MKQMRHWLIGGAVAALAAGAAWSDGTITILEQSGDVVITSSGTVDISGLSFENSNSVAAPAAVPSVALLNFGTPSLIDFYGGFDTFPASFGSGGGAIADSGTGSNFALNTSINGGGAKALGVPTGTGPSVDLNATMTFLGSTFGTLGMTPGEYEWTWTNPEPSEPSSVFATALRSIGGPERITLTIGPSMSAVPLPAGLPLLLAGLGAVAALRRRRS